MIDFFHKGAAMTKRISGEAKMVGAPEIEPRQRLQHGKVAKIGTFYDGEEPAASVLLEVADTDESRRKGLMGRSSLPDICGMLFEGLSGGGSFWMKDCLIPLDVAFISDKGSVVKMYSMPVDKDGERHFQYGKDVTSAVEVPMGWLGRHGISEGFKLRTRELAGRGDD